ncbi:hypothetical protein V2J09_008108 [Rumex salicifolius]
MSPPIELSNGKLTVKGLPLLSEVPQNVSFSPFSSICTSSTAPKSLFQRVQSIADQGGFLGFQAQQPSHRLITPLGKLKNRDFLSVFRFKTWWSTQWVGKSGSDLQMETQWILLNAPEIGAYVIIVPIIESGFRSALQPGHDDSVMINVESGSTRVKCSSFKEIAYVHVSANPYSIMKEAFSAVRVHLDTFRLMEEKSKPELVDKFGWCTWDAFYLTVDPIGVCHGVDEFTKAGISPRFIIIDDGWQSINKDEDDPNHDSRNFVLCGEQMTARLHRLDEGEKFRSYKSGSILDPNAPSYDTKRPKLLISKAVEIEHAEKAVIKDHDKIQRLKTELDEMINGGSSVQSLEFNGDCCYGMKAFTKDLRRKFKGLDDIFVWHALCGAWGGVRPGATHLNAKVVPCFPSSGLDGTMDDLAVVRIVEGGIGLVHPDQTEEFYESMHSHLASAGITGVKVDVIHKNFKGSNLISSMQHCNDFFFLGTKQISMGRVGDDFWFQDPNGDPDGVFWLQGVHMIHCSYNSLWMGQIIQPDWDMFQSDHICAKFHAGSRAICGGPIYVSDSLGGHNFDLLKKLVYPDGTIPKCQSYALPTRDCLFKNPLFDQKTVLKIWNFNKYGGVIGAFNCQGAGWDPKERRIKGYKQCYKPMEATIHVNDIEWDQNLEAPEMGSAEEYAVYLTEAGSLFVMGMESDPFKIVVDPSTYELFMFVPIKKLNGGASFAPIGVTNMLNSGGSVQHLDYINGGSSVEMKIKGEGCFLAYSSKSPYKCMVDGQEVDFEWFVDECKLMFNLPWIEEAANVVVEY